MVQVAPPCHITVIQCPVQQVILTVNLKLFHYLQCKILQLCMETDACNDGHLQTAHNDACLACT